jgi:ubiquinone biosynthesis protein
MTVLGTAATIGTAFKNAGRARDILAVFVSNGFGDLAQRMRLRRFLPRGSARAVQAIPAPVRLRRAFETLGTTFVKLGQLLASRPDLVPEAFVAELEKLQDHVAPVPFSEIRSVLESELGGPIEEFFASFEEKAMAAASIAQVHGAVLRDGSRVAVKVQRPGVERIIENDVSILRNIAVLLERYVPEIRTFNPTGIVDELFRSMVFETDFRVEANNIRRIGTNLAGMEGVAVPKVHTKLTTKRVLVLERFDGVRLSEREKLAASNVDAARIVRVGADAFFHMVLRDGIFHADPHAGNLFILPDGRLGFIDFGIVGRLSRRVQDACISMFVALVDEDYETLANEYLNLCPATGRTDVVLLQKDLMDTISPFVGMPLGEVNAGMLLLRSTSIAVRHHLSVPRELLLLFKAIFTIEALGKRLEPNFDILEIGHRLARQAVTSRYNPERLTHDAIVFGRDVQGLLQTAPRLLRRFVRDWSSNDFAFRTRSADTAKLAEAVTSASRQLTIAALGVCLFALTLTLLVLAPEPRLFGVPLAPMIAAGCSFATFYRAFRWRARRGE